MSLTIRSAGQHDLESIREIYNEAIRTTTATFDTQPRTSEQQEAWFAGHGPRHPVLVAEQDGEIVGWVALSRWSDRPAYDGTAETSFYVRQQSRGQGIGGQLKEAIIQRARELGYHVLIARVAEGSQASLHLNTRFGFVHVGTLKEVGRKFGRWLDVHVMQKILD